MCCAMAWAGVDERAHCIATRSLSVAALFSITVGWGELSLLGDEHNNNNNNMYLLASRHEDYDYE